MLSVDVSIRDATMLTTVLRALARRRPRKIVLNTPVYTIFLCRLVRPVAHTHSPVFFRFGMDVEPVVRTASGDKPYVFSCCINFQVSVVTCAYPLIFMITHGNVYRIYSNQWVCLNSNDSDRTEDMLFEETTLALDLHFVQLEQIRKHGTDDWTHGYLVELKKMVDDECKATSRLRRRALDLGNPPAYVVRLHRHRRHIACLQQEMDLIEQAVNDTVNDGDVLDVCLYLKHAIQTGSAIITGAWYSSPHSSIPNPIAHPGLKFAVSISIILSMCTGSDSGA